MPNDTQTAPTDPTPTLTTVDDATALLARLAEDHDWVSVFWDKRDRATAEITVMVDGNGHDPKAFLTPEVYLALVDQKLVAANSYGGYHRRRIHDYKTPPPAEKTGPDSTDIAETVIRAMMADMADQPIRAEFYRGLVGRPARVQYETVVTPAFDGTWFVLMLPGHSDVAISAQEPTMLGPDIIGGGIADSLAYPRTADNAVDVEALAGPAFRAQLDVAVRDKLAVIAAARAGKEG